MPFWQVSGILATCLCWLVTGCSLGKEQATRHYVLIPLQLADTAPLAIQGGDVAIGIGPVQLPQYTNRPEMVTGNRGPELHYAPYAQWGEPLRDNVVRVLAENLSLLLATERVAVFPWKGPMPMAYQVIVEVTQFLGEVGGDTSLVALWSIVGNHGREVLVSRKSSLREPAGQDGYAAMAEAMSRMVAALSREIAAAIAALAAQASPS
jgi:hypothetical protein